MKSALLLLAATLLVVVLMSRLKVVNTHSLYHEDGAIIYTEKYCPEYHPGSDITSEIDGTNLKIKDKTIWIGLLGSQKDPALHSHGDEELQNLLGDGVCEALAGYIPPVPEYLIAIKSALMEVNNNTSILPHHKLCVMYAISSSLRANIETAFSDFLMNEGIVGAVDALEEEQSAFIRSIISPFMMPTIQFADFRKNSHFSGRSLRRAFKKGFANLNSVSPSVRGLDADIQENYFQMIPHPLTVYRALKQLSLFFGWTRLGVLVTLDPAEYSNGDSTSFVLGDKGTFQIFYSSYNQSDPLASLRLFIDNEIQIFVFHGTVRDYLRVLMLAADHSFTGPG